MSLRFSLKFLVIFTLYIFSGYYLHAQTLSDTQASGSRYNSIRTAAPFLMITPDARVGAMGEAGVALSGDANSLSNNPSKISFLEQQSGFAASYSPWLRNIASDINLGYLSGYYKLDDVSTLGASLRYFSLGKIQLTDANQQDLGNFSPNEFAVDATYARRFGETFSLGTSIRYIYSNLSAAQFSAGQQAKAGKSLAIDVSACVKKPSSLLGFDAILSAGAYISNIGTKMNYTEGGDDYFLPTNLRIGGSSTFIIDDYNEITLVLDFNKLLVPTQPVYNTTGTIISGKNPDRSVPAGIFGSFSDAPGGFSEEMKEINISSGMEYIYNKKFALRAGYFYENNLKGDPRYFTTGTGIATLKLTFS
jgi:hypothetical protein